jgi:hypothetical protein
VLAFPRCTRPVVAINHGDSAPRRRLVCFAILALLCAAQWIFLLSSEGAVLRGSRKRGSSVDELPAATKNALPSHESVERSLVKRHLCILLCLRPSSLVKPRFSLHFIKAVMEPLIERRFRIIFQANLPSPVRSRCPQCLRRPILMMGLGLELTRLASDGE